MPGTPDDEQFDRPFKMADSPELSRFGDVPEWKQPDMNNQYGPVQYNTGYDDARQQDGYASTDFTMPTYLDPEDGW